MKDRINRWYAFGLWTAEMVETAVDKGVISAEEAEEILEEE